MSQKNKRKTSTSELKKIVVNTDGGSRGNPGPSAIGVVIATPKGEVLKEYGQKLDDLLTNNEAEYEAVIFALKKTLELLGKRKAKKAELEVNVGSELICKQVGREYKIKKAHLQKLFIQVQDLKQEFKSVNLKLVPREQNEEADALVNEALDSEK